MTFNSFKAFEDLNLIEYKTSNGFNDFCKRLIFFSVANILF